MEDELDDDMPVSSDASIAPISSKKKSVPNSQAGRRQSGRAKKISYAEDDDEEMG